MVHWAHSLSLASQYGESPISVLSSGLPLLDWIIPINTKSCCYGILKRGSDKADMKKGAVRILQKKHMHFQKLCRKGARIGNPYTYIITNSTIVPVIIFLMLLYPWAGTKLKSYIPSVLFISPKPNLYSSMRAVFTSLSSLSTNVFVYTVTSQSYYQPSNLYNVLLL